MTKQTFLLLLLLLLLCPPPASALVAFACAAGTPAAPEQYYLWLGTTLPAPAGTAPPVVVEIVGAQGWAATVTSVGWCTGQGSGEAALQSAACAGVAGAPAAGWQVACWEGCGPAGPSTAPSHTLYAFGPVAAPYPTPATYAASAPSLGCTAPLHFTPPTPLPVGTPCSAPTSYPGGVDSTVVRGCGAGEERQRDGVYCRVDGAWDDVAPCLPVRDAGCRWDGGSSGEVAACGAEGFPVAEEGTICPYRCDGDPVGAPLRDAVVCGAGGVWTPARGYCGCTGSPPCPEPTPTLTLTPSLTLSPPTPTATPTATASLTPTVSLTTVPLCTVLSPLSSVLCEESQASGLWPWLLQLLLLLLVLCILLAVGYQMQTAGAQRLREANEEEEDFLPAVAPRDEVLISVRKRQEEDRGRVLITVENEPGNIVTVGVTQPSFVSAVPPTPLRPAYTPPTPLPPRFSGAAYD